MDGVQLSLTLYVPAYRTDRIVYWCHRRKRKWEKREKLRKEQERRQRLEDKRWEFLERKIKRIEFAETLENFVAKYETLYSSEELPESSQLLLRWASNKAKQVRKEFHPIKLASVLDKHKLMDYSTDIYSWTRLEG